MKVYKLNEIIYFILNNFYILHIEKQKELYSLFNHDLSYNIIRDLLWEIRNRYDFAHCDIDSSLKNVVYERIHGFTYLNTLKDFKFFRTDVIAVGDEGIICFPKSIEKTVEYVSKQIPEQVTAYLDVFGAEKIREFEEKYGKVFEKLVDNLHENPVYQFVHDVLGYGDIKLEERYFNVELEEKIESYVFSIMKKLVTEAGIFVASIDIFLDKLYSLRIMGLIQIYIEDPTRELYKTILGINLEEMKYKINKEQTEYVIKTLNLIPLIYKAFIVRIKQYVNDLSEYAKENPLARKILFAFHKSLHGV